MLGFCAIASHWLGIFVLTNQKSSPLCRSFSLVGDNCIDQSEVFICVPELSIFFLTNHWLLRRSFMNIFGFTEKNFFIG